MNGNPNRMRQGRKKGRTATAETTKTWVTYFITKTHQKNRILNYYCISYTTAAAVVVVVAHRLGAPHYFVIKTTLPALP